MLAYSFATMPVLAETPAPVFLMSVLKPLVTLGLFVPYGALVAGKLTKDAEAYNLKPRRWSAIFLAFAAAAFLCVVLTPWWAAGVVGQALLLITPCAWYAKFRNKTAKGVKPLRIYNIDLARAAAQRREKSAQSSVTLRFQLKDRTEYPVPDQKSTEYATYIALQELLEPALTPRTQRLDLALSKQGAAVSQMADGIRAKRNPLPPDQATAVVDLLKLVAGLDPRERRKYQRGNLPVLTSDAKIILTVSSAGSMQGETIRVDIEREKQLAIPLRNTGLLDPQLALLKEAIAAEPKGGVTLVGARPGNGLTALGYALIADYDAFTNNIKTIERRPERQVDGVEHAIFDPSKAEYSTQLQSIVRRGPDVILASDIGEPGVAKVIAAPGSRSVAFYVLMPSDSVPDLIAAWVKAVNDPAAAAEPLKAVVACRLVRKLCPACRVAYQPTPDITKMLAIPAGKTVQLYRHSGKVLVKDQPADCPTCGGAGYFGLTGVFEVVALDDEARRLLKSGDIKAAYLQARRTHRSLSLQEAALMRVRAGDTSLDEIKRVFSPPAQANATAGAPRTPAATPPAAG